MRDEVKTVYPRLFQHVSRRLEPRKPDRSGNISTTGGGWNKTHETGWFLTQTRIMLMQERGDELWMAPFVTRNWLKDGMTVRCQNMPTNFGRAGYLIKSAVDSGTMEVVVDPPTVDPPSKIVLRLRHPEEKPIQSVTVDGKPHTDFDPKAETISLKSGSKQMVVRVKY